jgi:pilus assembly protein Flp/PilA
MKMNYFINLGKSLRRNESGATVIEYGLLAALIAVVVIGSVGTLGKTMKTSFEKINTDLAVQRATISSGTGTGPTP